MTYNCTSNVIPFSIKTMIHTHDATHRPTAGNAVVLELTGGDNVYIQADGVNDLVGGSQEIFCTFSGHLLAASGPSIIVGK